MAKDGTSRGGTRPGSGRKPKPLAEKLLDGNTGHRKTKVMEFGDIPELETVDMPEPHEMLSAEQRDGSVLQAKAIYEKTWKWLEARGCTQLISPQLLERYAMSAARWIQCEEITSSKGMIAAHPTTKAPIASPWVYRAGVQGCAIDAPQKLLRQWSVQIRSASHGAETGSAPRPAH